LKKSEGIPVSSMYHVGNERYIALDAYYGNEKQVEKIVYTVYKKFGKSDLTLVRVVVTKDGIHWDHGKDHNYGTSNRSIKERVFSAYKPNIVSEALRNNIKTIITGEL